MRDHLVRLLNQRLPIVLMTGVLLANPAGAGPPPEAPEYRPRPLATALDWAPTAETLSDLQTTSGLAFLLVSSDTCSSCPELEAAFTQVAGPLEAIAPIPKVEIRELPEDFRNRYGVRGAPTLLVFQDGEPIDLISFTYHATWNWMRHVMWRIGVTGFDQPVYISDMARGSAQGGTFPLIPGVTMVAHNFGAVDAADGDYRGVTMSGLGLCNADFSGANLTDAVIAGTDLTGARFDGAILEGVVWLSVICPDGTNSLDHENTCAAHLNPVE